MAHLPFVPIPDFAPFLGDPGDLVLVRRSFFFWQSRHRVHGTVMWGRPNEDDVVEMCSVWDTHLPSPYGSDPTLTDIRGLESIDILAFNRLLRVFSEKRAKWTSLAGPQAILHGGGLAGAAILGAVQLAGPGYRLGGFDSIGDALGWLDRSDVESDVAALRASLLDIPDIIRRVRSTLDAEPGWLTSTELARKLGLSGRSLQRHLEAAGTSLRHERTSHVVLRAQRLLEGTDLDLGAIAAMIGVGSSSRLVTLFRKVRGTTPGEFRRDRDARSPR
jgi:AraC-like DNA-binding protein